MGKNHRFKKWKERRREEKRRGEETKKERGKNKRNGNGCMLNQKNEIRLITFFLYFLSFFPFFSSSPIPTKHALKIYLISDRIFLDCINK